MSHLVGVPRRSAAPPPRSGAALALDVVAGIVGTSVDTGLAVARTAARWPPLRTLARPPGIVPDRWQPVALADGIARRGAAYRLAAARSLGHLLDRWAPFLVEAVVARLDLTGLVTRHVDIDEVAAALDLEAIVRRVDLDAAVEGVDLDAIVSRVDLDAAVEGVDLDAIVSRVDLDAVAARLDLDAVIERIDVVAIVEEVIDEIDLPSIIRDSSGSMASEAVRSARMTGISADEALSRGLERRLFHRRRPRPDPQDPP